jgi:hypothetical protein
MPEPSESQWNRIKDTLLEQAHQCATGAKKRCVIPTKRSNSVFNVRVVGKGFHPVGVGFYPAQGIL